MGSGGGLAAGHQSDKNGGVQGIRSVEWLGDCHAVVFTSSIVLIVLGSREARHNPMQEAGQPQAVDFLLSAWTGLRQMPQICGIWPDWNGRTIEKSDSLCQNLGPDNSVNMTGQRI